MTSRIQTSEPPPPPPSSPIQKSVTPPPSSWTSSLPPSPSSPNNINNNNNFIPLAVGGAAYGRARTKLFVLGGNTLRSGKFGQNLNQFFALDLSVPWTIESPTWIPLNNAGAPIQSLFSGAVSADGSVFVTFRSGDILAYRYHIAQGVWNPSAVTVRNPNKMGNFAVADLSLDRQLNPDQAIYLAGGYQADDTQMYVYGAGTDAMLPSFAISNMTLIDRNSYAGCYVKSRQSIFYLGGISRDGIKSPGEITEFVPATKSWSFLTFKGPSAYRPPHRVNLCIVANDDGTKVVVFGGMFDNNIPANDIWVLDVPTMTWTMGPVNQAPRWNPVCAIAGNTFIAWGGYNFTDTLDTMVLYNIDTNQLAFNYTPPPSYLNNDGNESKKIAVITCSVLVAVLALAGIGFWFLRRRRRRQRNPGLWMTYKNILGRESPFSTKYSKADARVDESASRWYDQDSTLSSRSKMVPIRTVEDLSYQYYSLQQQQQVVGTVEPKDNKYEYDPLMTSSRASQAPHTLFPQNPHTLSTDQILQQAQRQLEKQKIEVLLQQQQLLLQHQRRELIIGNMNRGQSRGVRPGVGALVGAGGVPSPVLGFGGIIDLTSGGVVPVGAGGDLGHDSGGGDGGCGGSIETLEQQTQQVQLQLYRLEKRQRQLQQQQHQQQW